MFLNYYFQWYVGPIYIYIYIYIYLYVLNKIGESTHPCLDPDLRGKVFSFSPLSMIVVMDLHIWPYYVEVHFFCSKFAEVFFLIMKRCGILSNASSLIYGDDHMIFILHSITVSHLLICIC